MTDTQRTELEKLLNPNEVLLNTRDIKNGVDMQGFPSFETKILQAPLNYTPVREIPQYNAVIVQDLDYKAVQDEPTNNA